MRFLQMVFVGVLVLVLAGQGVTHQGIGTLRRDSAQDRISVWDDTTAQRLLNHATGQAVPENTRSGRPDHDRDAHPPDPGYNPLC